jgi:hypothetical protein
MTEKKLFWCGWSVSDDIPRELCHVEWPDGMKGWCTGRGLKFQTYAGRVQASDADEAWVIVMSCYSNDPMYISKRWEPHECDEKTLYSSSRFPE